jgi:hypothetical protein
MLLPRLGDYIVSTEGYGGQMTDEPRDGTFYDNLFAPPPGDPGAHGRFDDRAESNTVGFDPSWLRAGALCAVLGLIAGAFAAGRSGNGGRLYHWRGAREASTPRIAHLAVRRSSDSVMR